MSVLIVFVEWDFSIGFSPFELVILSLFVFTYWNVLGTLYTCELVILLLMRSMNSISC